MACRSVQENRTYVGKNKEMNSSDFIKPEILCLDKSVGDESTECQPVKIQYITTYLNQRKKNKIVHGPIDVKLCIFFFSPPLLQ